MTKNIILPNKQLLTIAEVMDLLRVCRQTVYAYLAQGKLEEIRFSRDRRITRKSVEALLS